MVLVCGYWGYLEDYILMIFLSHNHKDKTLVEQIAIRLNNIFGQDQVFYDSWSIQPGEGIIDKMNDGLSSCKLFFFFVSGNSLQSKMVQLEWQNAVLKCIGGDCKLIPVKLDNCSMPAILLQNLYIDLYNSGLEVALRQIVDISKGLNTFSPVKQNFSNLQAYKYQNSESIVIECRAEYYLEPISHYLFLVENTEQEVHFTYKSGNRYARGFYENISLNDGQKVNGVSIKVEKCTVPGFPLVVDIKPRNGATLKFVGVMHEKSQNQWGAIPLINGFTAYPG